MVDEEPRSRKPSVKAVQATGRPVSLPLVYHLPVFTEGFFILEIR